VSDVSRLLALMARLRDPEAGCPWDVEQRFETIAPYTIEEAYEVDDAIRRGDLAALREELGDLLLQVVYHARMAEERGAFAFGDVVETLCEKLVRRHPHVFGDARVASAAAQSEAWEALKAEERTAAAGGGATSVFDGVARGLPALLRAQKLTRRAVRAGLVPRELRDALARDGDAHDAGARAAGVRARSALARACDEAPPPPPERRRVWGELLLALADLATAQEIDAEEALRDATAQREQAWRAREPQGGGTR